MLLKNAYVSDPNLHVDAIIVIVLALLFAEGRLGNPGW